MAGAKVVLAAYGRIDVLANIAGWGRYDWLEELSAENLRMQNEVNVIGLAELTRQVIPVMKRQRSGHILNMSSYASKIWAFAFGAACGRAASGGLADDGE